jgi:hypothetical protein
MTAGKTKLCVCTDADVGMVLLFLSYNDRGKDKTIEGIYQSKKNNIN